MNTLTQHVLENSCLPSVGLENSWLSASKLFSCGSIVFYCLWSILLVYLFLWSSRGHKQCQNIVAELLLLLKKLEGEIILFEKKHLCICFNHQEIYTSFLQKVFILRRLVQMKLELRFQLLLGWNLPKTTTLWEQEKKASSVLAFVFSVQWLTCCCMWVP